MTRLSLSHARVLALPLLSVFPLSTSSRLLSQPVVRVDSEQKSRGLDLVAEVQAGEVFGGGIVIGMSAESIYIATVRHVIRDADSPKIVIVAFHAARDSFVAANVSHVHTGGEEFDLAILTVPRTRVAHSVERSFEFDRLAAIGRLRSGDPVMSIGCPGSICWVLPADEHVLGVGNEITFLSQFMTRGKSGGALLNEWGEIAGMLLMEDQNVPIGRAMSIERLKEIARSTWAVPTMLDAPTFPRSGYSLVASVAPVFASEGTNAKGPGARLTLEGQLLENLWWHAGALRLAARERVVTSSIVGLSAPVQIVPRLTIGLFGDVGLGHVDARYDDGGYGRISGIQSIPVPNWIQATGFGFGGGAGGTLQFLVRSQLSITVMGATWAYQMPPRVPQLPRVFYSAGLGWAFK